MAQTEEVPLSGSDWSFRNEDGSITGMAVVPGSIYTDLRRNNFLDDPLFRFNDGEYRWVSKHSWSYSKSFNVSSQLLQKKTIELQCEGLDTIASLFINKKLIGSANNMFIRYIFPVKDFLQEGNNVLEVQFSSPTTYALDTASQYPYEVPPKCPPTCQRGDCQFNFIRKTACSFSWDWGPSFPTVGIWKPISIVGYDSVQIDYITVETEPLDQRNMSEWLVSGVVFMRGQASSVSGKLCINISGLQGPRSVCNSITLPAGHSEHRFRFKASVQDDGVKLWWPNGEGTQTLYTLAVSFCDANSDEVVSKSVRFGFRKIELLQEPVDKGLTFYFRVNGVPVFMKGSNWIPADSFTEQVTPAYLRTLLQSTTIANMNMLRVWGGGIYETDEFYDLADELGILIWQDFMFACALYPTNDDFLNIVRQEVTHQVRRLKHRACIALWAGNNENEAALKQNWWQVGHYERYYNDYVKLYVKTIREVVLQEDTSRPFVSSSPSNGVESEQEGWVAQNPQDEHYGDVHHYDYSADSWNWTVYPIPRFSSEYGLQAWCSFESIARVSLPTDWDLDGQFCDSRQHHTNGNKEMLDELLMHMNPPLLKDKAKRFKDFTYLTQINQAVGIKTETELYRRSQCDLSGGRGLTMGALYWQLNDIWLAPTWASIEYGGKWKMLHYYARDFFRPTLISPYLDGTTVKLFYINDMAASLQSVHSSDLISHAPHNNNTDKLHLSIITHTWDFNDVNVLQVSVDKPAKAAGLVWQAELSDLLKGRDRNECIIGFYTSSVSDMPNNWLLLSNFTTAVGLTKANIKVKSVGYKTANVLWISLTTDSRAPFVWLEAQGIEGYFSNNGFMMLWPEVTVLFHPWTSDNLDLATFTRSLSIRSLMDVYTDE